ncbi:MAG: phage minor capsid protein [Oscillospiraceae bacterium]|nr:phage minor capsid protein [Oscillospiraceae bacterium]
MDGNVIAYGALSETSYGEPAGLFGINCGHNCYPFIPGISTRSYFPYSPKENDEKYRQVQKQRRMERDIRKTKQECMMLNETGDKEGFADASIRLKAKREQYASYCSQAGLTARSDRTQVYGFDKSVSAKAVWAERKNSAKVLDNSGNGGIIKEIESVGAADIEVRKKYIEQNKQISKQIDTSQPLEAQARKACELRNANKQAARDAMENQELRKALDISDPIRSFDDIVEDKMKRKGLTREEAFSDIIETSSKTRTSVNKKLGLE